MNKKQENKQADNHIERHNDEKPGNENVEVALRTINLRFNENCTSSSGVIPTMTSLAEFLVAASTPLYSFQLDKAVNQF